MTETDFDMIEYKTLELGSSIDNVSEATSFVDANLESHDCPLKTMMQIDVVIDELFGNISNYAYGDKSGPVTVQVGFSGTDVVIRFIDCGVPYNPLNADDPDVTLSAEKRKIGGLGVFLVKKMMDDVRYEFREGKNMMTVVKSMV